MVPTVMINPEILDLSSEKTIAWEGCLSIPGLRGKVSRSKAVRIKYQSYPSGEYIESEYSDFVARVIQHEYDHLEGVVFLDRIASSLDLVTEQEYLKLITTNS